MKWDNDNIDQKLARILALLAVMELLRSLDIVCDDSRFYGHSARDELAGTPILHLIDEIIGYRYITYKGEFDSMVEELWPT